MIVLADIGDKSLAVDVQERLVRGGWRQFSSEMMSVDDAAKRITNYEPDAAIFVVGEAIDRLAVAIVCLRSFCSNPVIAISHGGSVRQIVQVMRVGATDIIDLDACFDAQLQTIVDQILATPCKYDDDADAFPTLRKSERRVALLLLGDLSENEIAQKLGLSYFTVRNHVKKIYLSCKVHSRVQFIGAFRKSTIKSSKQISPPTASAIDVRKTLPTSNESSTSRQLARSNPIEFEDLVRR